MFMKKIRGIIYDLDGTIISTEKLHESGWIYAGKKFNINISKEMLIDQKGISNKAASLMMLPGDKKHLLEEFRKAKMKYALENLKKARIFPYAIKTINNLIQRNYKIWICTAAYKEFVKKVLHVFGDLKIIENNIVWREMYKKDKPSPDALNLTIKKMNLPKSQVIFIGDAFNDYKTGVNAKIKFIYFCPNPENIDLRVPKTIPLISSHREIYNILKESHF